MGIAMQRDLEIRHCRALVAVHDKGGVGAAARALGLAQSTVSETLLSLERLLGTRVTLPRAGREAKLTAAAEVLLPHARNLIAASEAALTAAAGQSRAAIRLGTVESISSFLLPAPLRSFRQLWPDVDLRITIGLCEDLRAQVARGDLDVALTVEGVEKGRAAGAAIWPVRLCLVTAPGDPLARQAITARDLARRTLLLADANGGFNELLSSWRGGEVDQPRQASAGSVDGVKRGVLSGDAIGVLPDYAVTEELAAGSLVAVRTDVPLPAIALRLTTGDTTTAASPIQALVEELTRALQNPPHVN